MRLSSSVDLLVPGVEVKILRKINRTTLWNLLGVDEWLERVLDSLNCSIVAPDVSFESVAWFHFQLVLVVKEDHSFSYVAWIQPLLHVRDVDKNGTHLTSFNLLHRYFVTVNVLNLNGLESTFVGRTKPYFLLLLDDSLVNDTSEDQISILLNFVSLCDMKLSSICFFLFINFSIWKLKIIQKVFKQIDSLMILVTHNKDWTDNLTLHLTIDQNNILLIINDITNFLWSNFPDLCS